MEITDLQEACWGEKEDMVKGNSIWINGLRGRDDIKGAEQDSEFLLRIKRGREKALDHKGSILIVSHGGVDWLVQEILGLPIIELWNSKPVFFQPPQYPTPPWSVYPLFNGGDFYD